MTLTTPLKIGDLHLATNLMLAPVAGYTDVSFRLVARSCGNLGLAFTDLLCPQGLLNETRRSMQLAATCAEDSPLAMQIFGSDPTLLADAARWAEEHGAHVVDINMGCPVDRITQRDGGSKLLCNPDHAVLIVERVKKSLRHAPLTVKLRLGWDDDSIVAPSLARRLEDAGVAMITVHGRTTAQGFSGKVRLDGIAAVVAAVRCIPVIGNGDVRTPQDAKRMIEHTGCAGVMIGRGAVSAPWIFRDTWSYLTTGVIPSEPTLQQKCQFMRDHFANLVHFRGARPAVLEFRQRATWYAKHMNPCRMLREGMRTIQTPADFESVLDRFLDWRSTRDKEEIPDEP